MHPGDAIKYTIPHSTSRSTPTAWLCDIFSVVHCITVQHLVDNYDFNSQSTAEVPK